MLGKYFLVKVTILASVHPGEEIFAAAASVSGPEKRICRK
jgi:hypothetical protein